MRPDAPSVLGNCCRWVARHPRTYRVHLAVWLVIVAAGLIEHLLLPAGARMQLALAVIGLAVVGTLAAGRLSSFDVAATRTPTHPEALEGAVRLAAAVAVLLVLPALPGRGVLPFLVTAGLALWARGVVCGHFGSRRRALARATAEARERAIDEGRAERLWLTLSSHLARGARLHAVGLRRERRGLVAAGSHDSPHPLGLLAGRAAGPGWVLLDRLWLVPAPVGAARVTSAGLAIELRLLPGETPDVVDAVAERLAAAFEADDVRLLSATPSPRGETVEVEFRLRDPLESVVPPPVDLGSTVQAVPLGIDESGQPVTVPMLESSLLLGGLPGSGKSVALHVLLAGLAELENVAIIAVDPKRGAELGVWRPRLTALSTGDDLEDLLAALVAEMNRRLDVLAEIGEPKVTAIDLETFPLIVLVLDELAELLAGGITRDERARDGRVASLLRLLVAKGRAAGVVPVLATQKPSSDVIPTAIRDLIRERAAFATSTPEMTETVLGGGSARRAPAHEIRHDLPGVCFLLAERDREPVRARAYWLDRDDARRIAEATAHLRVGIPGIGDGFRVVVERSFE